MGKLATKKRSALLMILLGVNGAQGCLAGAFFLRICLVRSERLRPPLIIAHRLWPPVVPATAKPAPQSLLFVLAPAAPAKQGTDVRLSISAVAAKRNLNKRSLDGHIRQLGCRRQSGLSFSVIRCIRSMRSVCRVGHMCVDGPRAVCGLR